MPENPITEAWNKYPEARATFIREVLGKYDSRLIAAYANSYSVKEASK